ncbi:hypothetical protein BC739_003314 [Kutzneria viridogrisea]|uniref:SMI1/KNR4 family protein n=1 Tax=Kutzneria viridogrisea TaxID=47990 RepID=A0ABR6BH69_9PSEU|nr:hypothetical protein [Kutzneria viridogrisea]
MDESIDLLRSAIPRGITRNRGGENSVVLEGAREGIRELRAQFGADLPADVADFFAAVHEVVLTDLWNGYFLGPASWIADVHRVGDPRYVRSRGETFEVMAVACNGGGVLYVVPLPSGAPVLVLPSARIDNGVYLADTAPARGFRAVADDLAGFVEGLVDAAISGESDPYDPYRPR